MATKKKTISRFPEKKIVKINLEELGKEMNLETLTVQMGSHEIMKHSVLMFHDGVTLAIYELHRDEAYAQKFEISKFVISDSFVTVFLHNKELLGKYKGDK